jgi:hypothetical protein
MAISAPTIAQSDISISREPSPLSGLTPNHRSIQSISLPWSSDCRKVNGKYATPISPAHRLPIASCELVERARGL